MELESGTIGRRVWGCVFASFAARGLTGELTVGVGDKPLRIVFRNGAVVGAWSSLMSDSPARVGMTLNIVTSTQVAELLKRIAAAPNRDEIDVIAETLRLAPELAHRMRRRTTAVRAARSFALEGSPWVFEDRISLPVVQGSELDARGVLYLGARTHLSGDRLVRDVRALGGEVQLTNELVEDLPQFGFGELEIPVVSALRGGESVAELLARTSEAEQRIVYAVVYALAAWSTPTGGQLPEEIASKSIADDASVSFRRRPTSLPPTTTTIPPPSRTMTPLPGRAQQAAAALLARASQSRIGGATTPPLTTPAAPPSGAPPERPTPNPAASSPGAGIGAAPTPSAPTPGPPTANASASGSGIPGAPGSSSASGTGSQPRIAGTTSPPATVSGVPLTEREKAMREAIEARKRGEMALRREQFQLAIDEFSKAVQLDPRNGESAAMLAWAQFCVAPDKRAVAAETRRALERSISDTDQPTPQLFLGRVERIIGREREALRIFREILDMHPRHTEAMSEARVLEQRLANKSSRPK
jgi:methylphosphotriester-DNA--protein-cysteine methyltransferase|nr:hypothetical protein [Kofleriaceae bacterium]